MPPAQTFVDAPSLAILDFEISKLLISQAAHLIIDHSEFTALQFGEIALNQSGAADGIDRDDSARHLSALKGHSIAMPRNMNANEFGDRRCATAPRHSWDHC